MGKRGQNEGSISKCVDGRWMARVTLADGKRKYFYGKTRQEVAKRLNEALRDLQHGLEVVSERQTLGQYLTIWLDTTKPTVRPSTWKRYREYVTLHLIPTLGKRGLAALKPQQIQELYATKLNAGLSPTTVKHLHTVLHHALEDALDLGLLQRNVSERVKPPRMRRREMRVLTPEEAKILLTAARGSRLEALYVVALYTGMRQGELLALAWREVDLVAGHIIVRANLQRTAEGAIVGDPKTARGRRRIPIPPSVVRALRDHRERQVREQQMLGEAWHDHDLVFPSTIGTPLDANNLIKQFYRLLACAGVPKIRFHDLRHTAATLLLLQGVSPKVVSERLGHASIAITLDLYSHVLPDMQKEASTAMEALLGE